MKSLLVALLTALLLPVSVFAGSITLSWEAPTTNDDGTPLEDLKGYTVNLTCPAEEPYSILVPNITKMTFTVKARDIAGNESEPSNVAEAFHRIVEYTECITLLNEGNEIELNCAKVLGD